jgi:Uncharacterised protein family (UPF0175)
MMQVTIELPDEFVQRLQTRWHDTLAHYVRERLIMEAYRDALLSTREVQELLGLDDRFTVYDLCKKYDIVRFMPAFGDVWRGLVSPVLYTEETRTAMP